MKKCVAVIGGWRVFIKDKRDFLESKTNECLFTQQYYSLMLVNTNYVGTLLP